MHNFSIVEILRSYIKEHSNVLSSNTLSVYNNIGGVWQRLGGGFSTSITPINARVILKSILEHINDSEYSPSTKNLHISVLKVACRHYTDTTGNSLPTSILKKVKEPDRLVGVLNDHSIKCLEVYYDQSNQYYILTMLMLCAGMRVSEATNLTADQIDFEKKSIYIHEGKGKKSRMTYMMQPLPQILKNYITPDMRLLISNKEGNPIARSSAYNGTIRICKKARVEQKIHPHIFRHTFATRLVNKNIQINALQRILGHSDITTTQRYIHMNDHNIQSAFDTAVAM